MPIIINTFLLLFAIITQSRALSIGFSVSILYLLLLKVKNNNRKTSFIISATLVLSLILILSFYIKTDSSLGRILIYKITGPMLAKYWFHGIGLGRFSATYLYYQAKYFKESNYTIKELLLADNTYYAFNEYYQLILELGIVGILAVVIYLTLLVSICKCFLYKQKELPQSVIFSLSLIMALSVSAFFTYTFHNFFYQLIFLSAWAIVIRFRINNRSKALIAFTIFLMTVSIIGNWKEKGAWIINYKAYKRYKSAIALSDAGFKTECLQELNNIYPDLKYDGEFLWYYGKQLHNGGFNSKAEGILIEATRRIVTNDLFADLGKVCEEEGKIRQAESYYQMSINMVPNRFRPRYELYRFYCLTGQTFKAKMTSTEILAMPVKIPSNEIVHIRSLIINHQ